MSVHLLTGARVSKSSRTWIVVSMSASCSQYAEGAAHQEHRRGIFEGSVGILTTTSLLRCVCVCVRARVRLFISSACFGELCIPGLRPPSAHVARNLPFARLSPKRVLCAICARACSHCQLSCRVFSDAKYPNAVGVWGELSEHVAQIQSSYQQTSTNILLTASPAYPGVKPALCRFYRGA